MTRWQNAHPGTPDNPAEATQTLSECRDRLSSFVGGDLIIEEECDEGWSVEAWKYPDDAYHFLFWSSPDRALLISAGRQRPVSERDMREIFAYGRQAMIGSVQ